MERAIRDPRKGRRGPQDKTSPRGSAGRKPYGPAERCGVRETMARRLSAADRKTHRRFAVECFNGTWKLLLKKRRTKADDLEMVHRAHASRYHWGVVGNAKTLAIGEWQVSHVYAVLRRTEPALYHAKQSLRICREHRLGDFPLAYAFEALARASATARRGPDVRRFVRLARSAGARIEEADDRKLFFDDLETI